MAADRLFMYNWYHGVCERKSAEAILQNQRAGLFLVRDSRTQKGDFVLSVSESNSVRHYIINQRNGTYTIGDQTFDDLPDIIEFYKRHFLDTTTLVEVAPRQQAAPLPTPAETASVGGEVKVKAKYNFPGNDTDDLPFRKNEVLTVIAKPEESWWQARDSTGKEGMIPVNYVEELPINNTLPGGGGGSALKKPPLNQNLSNPLRNPVDYQKPADITVPAIAEAIQARQPCVYDPSELKFMPGDRILVLKMADNGSWEGQLKDGRIGMFPFRFVKLLTSDSDEVAKFRAQIPQSVS